MLTDRQREIVEVAIELIDLKGIQGLTMKNISKKIKISEPAIYRHFESKIHIISAILNMLKEGSQRLYEEEITSKDNAIDKISELFNNYFGMFSSKKVLASVLFSEELFQNEKELKNKVREIIEHNHRLLVTIIVSGQQRHEIREDIRAEDLATMIMGTLRLFVKQWQFSGFQFDLKEEGNKIIQMIKNLILIQ
jgi:AcrR family transcriptional regulator